MGTRILPILISTLLLGSPFTEAEPTEDRQGWHGEAMPLGLARGEVEGEYVWSKDDSVMIYVPPGKFTMGSEDGVSDERPVRDVWLDGYYIDKYEVSWKQWKAAGFTVDEDPDSRQQRPRAPDWGIVDEQPALNINWHEAREYLHKVGKRLPSEAEWEKAARGTDGRVYPWGNEPPTYERAMWKDNPAALESTGAVDCCAAGASPYGVFNMAGNVYEWCQDTYYSRYYLRAPERNPRYDGPGRYRVLRGGAFVLDLEDLRSARRYRLFPEDRTPYVGFRGAVSGVPRL